MGRKDQEALPRCGVGWQHRCKLCVPGEPHQRAEILRYCPASGAHTNHSNIFQPLHAPSQPQAQPRAPTAGSPQGPAPALRSPTPPEVPPWVPEPTARHSGRAAPEPPPQLLLGLEHSQRPAARTRGPDEGQSRSQPPPAPSRPLAGGCCRDATARHGAPSPSINSRSRARPHRSPPLRAASGGTGGASGPAPAQRARQRWDGRAHAVLTGRAGGSARSVRGPGAKRRCGERPLLSPEDRHSWHCAGTIGFLVTG
ncbi:uncharacterized protein LOC113460034 [Zonotrichia albicollis]|uniref:uncharacterized protein LOC113460034 n=1 Tax=Zonotrichia albicollis TaxID=44394 RepID=UPI003D80B870